MYNANSDAREKGRALYESSFSPSDSKELKVKFSGSICIIGCGSVSQCLQPLLVRHMDMDFSKMVIIDMLPDQWGEAVAAGARMMQIEITKDNMDDVLGRLVCAGDMLIDLAWNIDTVDLVEWCQARDVLFLNTSVEV